MTKKVKCPKCKKEVTVELEYNKKYGREGKCPGCGKKFYFVSYANGFISDVNGTLRRAGAKKVS